MKTQKPEVSTVLPQKIGYARVSSVGQNLDSQMDALQQAGCDKIFSEKMTGSRMDRPAWNQFLEYVRSGDTLVVTEVEPLVAYIFSMSSAQKIRGSEDEQQLRQMIAERIARDGAFRITNAAGLFIAEGQISNL